MKLKKILAVTIGAALAVSTALALSACGNDDKYKSLGTTSDINIDNYVQNIADADNAIGNVSNSAYTTAKLINTNDEFLYASGYGYMIFRKSDTDGNDIYSVYNTDYDKFVAQNLENTPVITQCNVYNYTDSIYLARINNGDYTYSYIAPDGTKLLDSVANYNPRLEVTEKYIGNASETSQILIASANEITNYFRISENASGLTGYSKVDSSNLYDAPISDYGVGQYITKKFKPLYESTSEKPVTGEIADYDVVVYETTVEFYKNGEVTGTLSLENAEVAGFVGNYVYYSVCTPVEPDATEGYNAVKQDTNKNVIYKYDLHQYQYDVVANTTKELKYNVLLQTIRPCYNYSAKSYDAAVVVYNKMVDGLFIIDSNYFGAVTDADLNVAYDLTGKAATIMPQYKLADNRYLAGDIIVDSNLDAVTAASSTDVYAQEQLVKIKENNLYGFKDYNGKVVIAPIYTSVSEFYGDWALASKNSVDGTKYEFIKKDGTVKAMPQSEGNITVDETSDGIYRVQTYNSDSETYKVEFYGYGGTLIKSFTELTSSYSVYISDANGNSIIYDCSGDVDKYYLVK